jgi:Glycosyl hydrolase family 26
MKIRDARRAAVILSVGAGAVALSACSGPSTKSAAPPRHPTGISTSSSTLTPTKIVTGASTPTSALAPASTTSGVVLGLDTWPHNDANAIAELGQVPAIINGFFGWYNPNGATVPFPSTFIGSVTSRGATPMITWNPADGVKNSAQGYTLASIISGQHDAYIQQWAQAAKANGHTILVRLMHEMNGSWYPWGAGVNGNTPAEYVAAYQHVVRIFQAVGATNVQFVWCVATSSASLNGTGAQSTLASYFPGNQYVSWVAMDGYNRSATAPKSFAQIFGTVYTALTQISNRPVMVAETATVDMPGNPNFKAQWIQAAFAAIPTTFPRIKAVLYFDTESNGFSYPFDSSSASLAAIKQAFATPAFHFGVPSTALSY